MTQKQLKLYKVGVTIEFVATTEDTLNKHDRADIEDLFNAMLSDVSSDLKNADLQVRQIHSLDGIDGLPAGWSGECIPWGEPNPNELTCRQVLEGVAVDPPNKESVLTRLHRNGHITDDELKALEST